MTDYCGNQNTRKIEKQTSEVDTRLPKKQRNANNNKK